MKNLLKKGLGCFRLFLILHSAFYITSACTSPPDRFGDLDLVKWRGDRGACKGERTALIGELKKAQTQLLGEQINDVTALFGRPDIHQLAGRDQKYYVYFLEKGTHCQDIKSKSAAQKVLFHFNSVGLLSEVIFQTAPL
jgi:hypothetical protein